MQPALLADHDNFGHPSLRGRKESEAPANVTVFIAPVSLPFRGETLGPRATVQVLAQCEQTHVHHYLASLSAVTPMAVEAMTASRAHALTYTARQVPRAARG